MESHPPEREREKKKGKQHAQGIVNDFGNEPKQNSQKQKFRQAERILPAGGKNGNKETSHSAEIISDQDSPG